MEAAETKWTLEELEKSYNESEQIDRDPFAEMRSNILLVAGQHYSKRSREEFESRILTSRAIDQTQKIRLTMNHIQKASRMSEEYILEQSPGVKCAPQNDRETQDVKSAELHNAVLAEIKRQVNFDQETTNDVSNFFQIGEVACKIFWDDQMGVKLSEEQYTETDEKTGEPVTKTRAIFSGMIISERIYGFNLMRPKGAQDLLKAPWLMIRKMMPTKDLKAKLGNNPEELKKISQASSEETFVVFDAQSGDYRKSNNEVLVKELYVRPCAEYPNGWFCIWTKNGILFKGELPGGIFPIVVQTYEQLPTLARGVSQLRHGRPYQAEINRCASKIAEHQITLGDDKLVTFNNSRVTKGADLPGVRHLSVGGAGAAPLVIAGRTGDQYLEYMNQKIAEFYSVMMLQEESEQKGQNDPYSMLLRRARQKKRFSKYATKFELFLVEKYKTALEIFRYSCPEGALIPIVGKQEQVNITEFKNAKPSQYQIKVEVASADVETQFAKQLSLQQLIQYIGAQLSREDLGKMISAMPFLNGEEMASDMTLQYRTAQNVVLALDRGEQPPIADGEDHDYMIKKLNYRMTLSDFRLLDPQVQQNYVMRLQAHQGIKAEQVMLEAQLKQGFIPTTGPLIPVGFYVTDPDNQTRTRQARIPMDAVRWLIDSLTRQGSLIEQLDTMPANQRAAIAQNLPPAMNPQMQGGMNGGNGQPQPSPGGPRPGPQQPGPRGPGEFNGSVGSPGEQLPRGPVN